MQEAGFTERTKNTLLRAGINTLNELALVTKREILVFDGIGRKSFVEVENVLRQYGMWYKVKNNTVRKFLVRPDDFSIFELDESNGCYRCWSDKEDANRPSAMPHFTFENLTKNYGFFQIDESELDEYNQRCSKHYELLSRQYRPDGHGGIK